MMEILAVIERDALGRAGGQVKNPGRPIPISGEFVASSPIDSIDRMMREERVDCARDRSEVHPIAVRTPTKIVNKRRLRSLVFRPFFRLCHSPKPDVAGSIPVSRSNLSNNLRSPEPFVGGQALTITPS